MTGSWACRLVGVSVALTSTVAGAKDPPSAHEVAKWTACLESAGVTLDGDRSSIVLESAFDKCSAEEENLRRAITRDPAPSPAEYAVDNMKRILRAQREEGK